MAAYRSDSAEKLKIDHMTLPMLGKSLLVGAGAGVICTAFRWCVAWAEETAFSVYGFVGSHHQWIVPLFLALAAVGLLIGLLVKYVPMANSSGIPQVKGLITGQLSYCWWKVLPAKFVGAVTSTVCGLALGREGPAIQLGGCVGQAVGDNLARSEAEKKILIAGGAGAGLGTVLGAPLAGVMFAVEDMLKYFSPAIMICTITSALASQFICAVVFGLEPIFTLGVSQTMALSQMWVLVPMGIVVGFCGAAFNKILLVSQEKYKRLLKQPWLRIVIPFLLAGCLGLLLPEVLCGGEIIINNLYASLSLGYLLLLLAVKFCFFTVCFDSAAPGGNLFPILVLGANIGAVCGYIAVHWLGFDAALFPNFVMFAMAAYFAAIARTPVTGILLLLETTGAFGQLLPLAIATVTAYAVSVLIKSPPIYDALLEARVAGEKRPGETDAEAAEKKCRLEFLVHYGSQADGAKVGELPLPADCRIVSLERGEGLIYPQADTVIKGGDYLLAEGCHCDEAEIFSLLTGFTAAEEEGL